MDNPAKSGFLLLNKPAGPTSFDCIRRIKKLLPKKTKVGHTGTLDDFASGLLIICIGREATKKVPLLMGCDKEYVVRAKLGELTDSLDRTGHIIQTVPFEHVTADHLIAAMHSLCPSYTQIPPVYSALKYQGKPLYALARKQKLPTAMLEEIVQKKGREVFIKNIELLEFAPPFFTFRAMVSTGTYARSLAHDIAQKCGTGATTYVLERTKINELRLENAVHLEEITSRDYIEDKLVAGAGFEPATFGL